MTDSSSPIKPVHSVHEASKRGDLFLVRKIVEEENHDINEADTRGCTPVYIACRAGHLKIVQYLCEHGADIERIHSDETCLHIACWNNQLEVARFLIDHGADLNSLNASGCTYIQTAALKENLELLELLTERGADIYATAQSGDTALHSAALAVSVPHHVETVQWLLKAGLDVNQANNDGCTAFHVAAEEGKREMLEMLAENGADVTAVDRNGETAIHYAIRGTADTEIVLWLIGQGVDIDHLAHGLNMTPLMLAAKQGDLEIVNILLHNGVNAELINNNGKTAVSIAVEAGKGNIAREIRKRLKIPHSSTTKTEDTILADIARRAQKEVEEKEERIAELERKLEMQEKEKQEQEIKETIKKVQESEEAYGNKFELQADEESKQKTADINKDIQEQLKKIYQKLEVVDKKMDEGKVEELVKLDSVKEVVESQRSDIEKTVEAKMEEFMEFTKDIHASVAKQGANNDYVYYRTFIVIAKEAGESLRWKELATILLKKYPESHVKKTIKDINSRHSSDFGKCFEVLMMWKVFVPGDVSISALLEAIEPMFLNIAGEVQGIMENYNTSICYDKKGCLTDREIIHYAEGITDYTKVAICLGLKKAEIEHIESDCKFKSPDMAREVLFRWRAKEVGATEKRKAVVLLDVFRECELDDLVKHLQEMFCKTFN